MLRLVSAPLGYGKSTLLAQYAASLNTPWAWLRCAATDNQPAGFLTQLHCALKLPRAPLGRADAPLPGVCELHHSDVLRGAQAG